jgi:hypothetical protein
VVRRKTPKLIAARVKLQKGSPLASRLGRAERGQPRAGRGRLKDNCVPAWRSSRKGEDGVGGGGLGNGSVK